MNQIWKDTYNQKLTTKEEAVKIVRSGEKVYLGAFSGVAGILADALYERKDALIAVDLITLSTKRRLKAYEDQGYTPFRIRTPLPGPMEDQAAGNGMILYYSPYRFSEVADWFENCCRPDVAFVETSAPNSKGYVSFGAEGSSINQYAFKLAKKKVFQINRHVPFVYGADNMVSLEEADMIVEGDDPLPLYTAPVVTDTEEKIASLITGEVPDEATLALDGGAISLALGSALKVRKDMGIHTEIFSEALMMLMESGAVTNGRKRMAQGKSIYCRAEGDGQFAQFLHGRRDLYCGGALNTNDPRYIMQNNKMVSVQENMVFNIYGQAGSRDAFSAKYHLQGNVLDYVRGAQWSNGGKSILASPSVYMENGERKSSIVFELPHLSGVIVPAADVQYVATEYGCINLKHLAMDDRIRAMISLAHPDFRKGLLEEAKAHQLI